MPTERRQEWITYRKLLLLEIQDGSRSISEIYSAFSAKVNGYVKDIDFVKPESLVEFEKLVKEEWELAASKKTDQVVNTVTSSAGLADKATDAVDKVIFKGAKFETKLSQGAPDVAERLMKKRYDSGFRLSDSVWSSDKQLRDQFNGIIEDGIKNSNQLQTTIERLSKLKSDKFPEKLPKFLKEIENQARRAAGGLPGARQQYEKLRKSLQKKLDARKVLEYQRPTNQGLSIFGTRRQTDLFLKRLDRAIKKNSEAMVNEAINETLVKKAEYRATVAMRTLSRKAFEDTAKERRKKRPWVIGEKYNLSASHPRYDECDLRADLDLGQGPGVYPVGQSPDDHPNGLCFTTDVIDDDYLKRDKPLKVKYDKGYKDKIGLVQPGGDLAKVATKLGQAQNTGRIAKEIQKLGIVPGEPVEGRGYKKFSFDQVAKYAGIDLKPKPAPIPLKPKAEKPKKSTAESQKPIGKQADFKPLKFKKQKDMDDYYFIENDRFINKMSDAEFDSLRAYTGNAYNSINDALREISPASESTAKHIKNIDNIFEKATPLNNDIYVYRGVRNPQIWNDIKNNKIKLGDIYKDKAFQSTSINSKTAYKFMEQEVGNALVDSSPGENGVFFKIKLPEGFKGAVYADNPEDLELLLNKNVPLKFVEQKIKKFPASSFNAGSEYVEFTMEIADDVKAKSINQVKTKIKDTVPVPKKPKAKAIPKPEKFNPVKFKNTKDIDSWGVSKFKPAKLYYGDDVYSSLTYYKDIGYDNINSTLRGIDKGLSQEKIKSVKKYVSDIDKAINKTVIPDDVVVYRGVRNQEYEIGKIYNDKAFMSTSLSEKTGNTFLDDFAKPGDTKSLLEIKVKKGYNGVWMDDFDIREDTGMKEYELLLKRNTKLKITGKTKIGNIVKYFAEVIL